MGEIARDYGDCEFFHKHRDHAIVDQISQTMVVKGSMMWNLLFIEHWFQIDMHKEAPAIERKCFNEYGIQDSNSRLLIRSMLFLHRPS